MLYKQYKIILKYYQANVLESTYNVQRIISNEKELEFIFGRNQQAEGVFQEFADTFIFIKEDREYIIDKRNDYLARKDRGTYLQLEFHALNRDTITYDIEYVGKLKFEETVIENLYANCPFTVDTAFNRLNAIQEDIVSIEKDGVAYPYEISLTAVYDSLSYVGEWNDWNWDTISDSPESYPEAKMSGLNQVGLPFTSESDKKAYDFFNSGVIYFKDDANIIFRNPKAEVDISAFPSSYFLNKVCTLEVSAYIIIKYDPSDSLTWENKYVLNVLNTSFTPTANTFTVEDNDVSILIEASKLVFDDNNNVLSTVDFVTSQIFRLRDLSGAATVNTYTQSEGFIFNLGYADLTFDGTKTSQIVAHPLREILDDYETIQGLTINTDALDGTIYDVNNILLSTSRGIKGITPLTYQFSFQKWFNSAKAFQALSFSYVGDTIYILPILDAYDDSQTKELPEALSLEISENDKGFNLLTVGNSGGGSSNFTYEDLDPLAQATYDLGLETEQKKEFSNDIRVDGSTINKAAIDYEKVTTDIAGRDDDKDLYFIARKIGEPTVVSQFTLISGVDFQKFGQAINMEYSKSRQLYNWRDYNGHLLTGVSEFQLKSWDKNKDLVYTDTDRGINVIDTPETISGFDDVEISPIFGENLYTVELPQKSGLYQFIKANPNIVYRIPFKGEYYEGYIEKVGLNPLIREVITVELTEKYIPRTTILSDSNEVVYSDDNFVILEKGY